MMSVKWGQTQCEGLEKQNITVISIFNKYPLPMFIHNICYGTLLSIRTGRQTPVMFQDDIITKGT